MPMQHCRVLGGLLALVLAIPPLAILMARSGGDMVSWANLTLLVVELVVASGLVLAWHLRRYLSPDPQPRLVPVKTSARSARGSRVA